MEAGQKRKQVLLAGVAGGLAVGGLTLWLRCRAWRQLRSDGWICIGPRWRLSDDAPVGWKSISFETPQGATACALRRNQDGMWIAFARSCPHAGIDLLRGDIEDLGFGPIIGCPAHSYLWHTQSGTCLWDSARPGPPETDALHTFETLVHGGYVWIREAPPPAPWTQETWSKDRADALQLAHLDKVLERRLGKIDSKCL
mmetsp:Transcript_65897/g.123006  ORF Transcript_65897/g.123006 Transcript_65897/m.123006 type:complete len:199 (+) Transcript_65897:89-685(+)